MALCQRPRAQIIRLFFWSSPIRVIWQEDFAKMFKVPGAQCNVWYGMGDGMKRKFRNGIQKMPQWNGMEDFKNGIENDFPYFHTIPYWVWLMAFTKNIYE